MKKIDYPSYIFWSIRPRDRDGSAMTNDNVYYINGSGIRAYKLKLAILRLYNGGCGDMRARHVAIVTQRRVRPRLPRTCASTSPASLHRRPPWYTHTNCYKV